VSTVAEPIFDDYEKELVRFFAQRYLAHQEFISHAEFPRYEEVGKQKVLDARRRIREAGLIEGMHTEGIIDTGLIDLIDRSRIKVLPTCLELVHAWDNPPMPDYWDKMTKWFWSKPWSVVVFLVVVVLPALVGYIVMLKTIAEWLGILKGSSPK
jgi:hypothetical protein